MVLNVLSDGIFRQHIDDDLVRKINCNICVNYSENYAKFHVLNMHGYLVIILSR